MGQAPDHGCAFHSLLPFTQQTELDSKFWTSTAERNEYTSVHGSASRDVQRPGNPRAQNTTFCLSEIAGIATSLKILFDSSDCGANGAADAAQSGLVLERNEVIALFNLLERLSKSIEVVRQMSLQLLEDNGDQHPSLGAIEAVTENTPLFSQFMSS